MLNVKKVNKRILVIATTLIIAIGAIGTTASALASKNTPVVNPVESNQLEDVGYS